MKKIILIFLSLLAITTVGFTENITLDNQTSYPIKDQKSKIAVQWANSAKEIDEGNNAIMHGGKLNSSSLQVLTSQGKVELKIPKKAEYFRVLVWSKGEGDPDFHTNWVDVIPGKAYTLQTDHLVPSVLMPGMGC